VLGTPPAFILSQDQTLHKQVYGISESLVPCISYHFSVVKDPWPPLSRTATSEQKTDTRLAGIGEDSSSLKNTYNLV
jgi:hypothetical protein